MDETSWGDITPKQEMELKQEFESIMADEGQRAAEALKDTPYADMSIEQKRQVVTGFIRQNIDRWATSNGLSDSEIDILLVSLDIMNKALSEIEGQKDEIRAEKPKLTVIRGGLDL